MVTEDWSPHWGPPPGLALIPLCLFLLFRLGTVHVYSVLTPDLHHSQQPSNLQQAGARLDRPKRQTVCRHCRRYRYHDQRPVHQTLGGPPRGASPEPTRPSETPHSQLLVHDTLEDRPARPGHAAVRRWRAARNHSSVVPGLALGRRFCLRNTRSWRGLSTR